MRYKVGDIVRIINTYWYGHMNEPRDDIGKLFVISEVSCGYGIRDLETGSASYWWHDDQLEYVDHDDSIFEKLNKIADEICRKNNDLKYIKSMYPNIATASWLKLFNEIGYNSSFNRNGEYYVLFNDIMALRPIFDYVFDGDLDKAIECVPLCFKPECVKKYQDGVRNLYNRLSEIKCD